MYAGASAQLEVNISNINSQNQIVINDLYLLELLFKYPFLFNRRIRPQQDPDYEEWAWEQIAKSFNANYGELPLSAPFSVEELQWRWSNLKPILGNVNTDEKSQIPEQLDSLMKKMQSMMGEQPPPLVKRNTALQNFLIDHVPLVENLSEQQRRKLEVEVLNAIFQKELSTRATIPMGKLETARVQREYDEFLKNIRVKEIPPNATIPVVQPNTSAHIVNTCETNLVISSVCSTQNQPLLPIIENVTSTAPTTESVQTAQEPTWPSSPPYIKPEPEEQSPEHREKVSDKTGKVADTTSIDRETTDNIDNNLGLRYVPLKCAKYYIQNVRVRLKRVEIDDYLPLATIRKLSRSN
ncbi:uncharacterized protein LOC115625100 [Scaptodrosophila lebanonensis]|uniref:Uncharacterized protein LOC115625100 n=1 Tax=Drosophila lebanonensis TaxID=7225 RepID=A0A6J2TMP8_DROLE|nr:uncharacterized protein LOC115625100 [Scaptodrosophila lebanonensis]